MTVTVFAEFQSEVVKVRLEVEICASVLSSAVRSTTTSLVGCEPSLTVNVSVLPFSLTSVEPSVSLILIATVSSSVIFTVVC